MDWQGFTKRDDVASLERLHDPEYRDRFIDRTLQEFVQTLDDADFNSTELLAELVRLEFLQIKLIKMDSGRGIYHRKTGILSDNNDNHILHEGSDNFTRAAHSRNAESVTFFKSWEGNDRETIIDSIHDFDREWGKEDISFNLTQTFLQQVLLERDRRIQQNQPQIESIVPTELPPGETTAVIITGTNLDTVETIDLPDNDLIQIDIIDRTPTQIDAEITISPEYPPQAITEVRVKDKQGEYNITPTHPPQVKNAQQLPDFAEIDGFRAAAELILAGKYGQPQDFLYWLAQKQIQQFKITRSDLLDTLVDRGILFQHQKDGAQHCLMVMANFGVAVCADAVGLGKTRLAAAVARLYRQQTSTARIAIIAAQKLHLNWEREMSELGLEKNNHYGLFNKNRMSRRGQFIEDFTRFGADLVIIDEAHEGIRNDKNRIHKLCLELKERDSIAKRNRHYLLLTATPWNNRREDIYNILYPFLTRPEGFKEWDFPVEVSDWFKKRDTGVNQFVDNTPLFRRTYRQIFLQRTRQMLRDAMPDLNVYAKRQAEWLPVIFEPDTEVALDRIFTRFETDLFIPSADPIKYLSGNVEQRSLLANQRRFFLQRAESSMYALRRTIVNFRNKIELMQSRLDAVTPDASGLEQFLLLHYGFNTLVNPAAISAGVFDSEDEDYEESEEEEESEGEEKQEKRQQLRRSIEIAIHHLEANLSKAKDIYQLMQSHCEADLIELQEIQQLLADEFVKDHKRSQVTAQVQELIRQGKKVLLISTFSDTVVDYYRYMAQKPDIDRAGIGMAIGSTKYYRADDESGNDRQFLPHNATKNCIKHKGMKRQELFRLFAPVATCREPNDRPPQSEEIMVLIGSETLSVGQNMQDADYLINIDLPWNPMVLEQRIGRIDRPKQHHPDNIYIYYANSESQLLRQASRLKNLNKKLVGDRFNIDSENSGDLSNLGASIYGDTLFDDAILPDYVNFLGRLAQVRKTEQENWQENCYHHQEQTTSMYTQYELLFREDVSEKIRALGEDYLANPIALGAGGEEEVKQLVALTIDYFDPNGKLITEERQTIYWNDKTGEKDAYGLAIATANQTPALGRVIPRERSLTELTQLYDRLVKLKQEYLADLDREETTSDVKTASERLSRIQQRIQRLHLNDLPADISPKVVKTAIGKLDSWKESKVVEKLLRAYNDGEKSQLPDTQFLMEFLTEVDLLNLIDRPKAKKVSLKIAVNALLLKV
jgi:superfamily II DNA or RNA helicase